MTQAEKLQKCDDVLREMYFWETGVLIENDPRKYARWVKANYDRLQSVIRSIMSDSEVSADD